MKAGTRVYYWNPLGETVFGTVLSSGFLPDNTHVLTIRDDNGRIITMPSTGLHEA